MPEEPTPSSMFARVPVCSVDRVGLKKCLIEGLIQQEQRGTKIMIDPGSPKAAATRDIQTALAKGCVEAYPAVQVFGYLTSPFYSRKTIFLVNMIYLQLFSDF